VIAIRQQDQNPIRVELITSLLDDQNRYKAGSINAAPTRAAQKEMKVEKKQNNK
jgi:hypothetical protein